MRAFTDTRQSDTPDALWVVEHPSVYTLGQAGKREHILNAGNIPVVQSDRGGQVTWHGPGQLVIYTLLDLRRQAFGIRDMVIRLETAVIDCLAGEGIASSGRRDAPGVYVLSDSGEPGAKIAALGLRVRRGCSYHGLALNVNPDLAAFEGINPCGYAKMPVTSLQALGVHASMASVTESLLVALTAQLGSPSA